MSRSAALRAGRFVPEEVDIEDTELETVLKTFGRLSGFALEEFALSFRPTEDVVAIAATGLAENDKTTFSAPSSLFRPSATGGGDPGEPEPEAVGSSPSTFARSICSAINKRSRCSSGTVERSFLSAASYSEKGSQQMTLWDGAAIYYLLLQCLRATVNPSNKPAFLRLIHPCNPGSS